MDNQSIYNWIIGGFLVLLGWLGRSVWDAVNSLKEDVKNLEVSLPEKYVTKQDIEKRFDNIDKQFDGINIVLQRIFDKMDHKVDKGGCQ